MSDLTRQIAARRAAMHGWKFLEDTPAGVVYEINGKATLISGYEHDLNVAWELLADFDEAEQTPIRWNAPLNPMQAAEFIASEWWVKFSQE